jgi:hypothetical protein
MAFWRGASHEAALVKSLYGNPSRESDGRFKVAYSMIASTIRHLQKFRSNPRSTAIELLILERSIEVWLMTNFAK